MGKYGTSRRGKPKATAVFAPQLNIQPIAVARDLKDMKINSEVSRIRAPVCIIEKLSGHSPWNRSGSTLEDRDESLIKIETVIKNIKISTRTKTIEQVETADWFEKLSIQD